MVTAAVRYGLNLWQNYNPEAPRQASQGGRYVHANPYRRMKKTLRILRTRVGG